MKSRLGLKALVASGIIVAAMPPEKAHAYPELQLDIQGGHYNDDSRNAVLEESVVTSASSFTLGALLTPGSASQTSDTYALVIGITNPDGSQVSSASGSLVVNGSTYNLSSFTNGSPYGIQSHGVYDTLSSAIGFDFTGASRVTSYNVEDNPGGWTVNASGGSYVQTFTVDRSGLGNYLVQFDLVRYSGSSMTDKAPFSHDAASLVSSGGDVTPPGSTGVPEPASLTVLGSGLLALGAIRRRRRKAAL